MLENMLGNVNIFSDKDKYNLYDNVDEHLKKEASLISHVDYQLGELDSSSHKAAVHLKVVPKNIAEDLQLSVSLGEESVAFVKKDNEYTASLLVNIFLDYGEHPMLHMQTSIVETSPLLPGYVKGVYTDENYTGRLTLLGYPNNESVYYVVQEFDPNYRLETVHKSETYQSADDIPNGLDSLVDITATVLS